MGKANKISPVKEKKQVSISTQLPIFCKTIYIWATKNGNTEDKSATGFNQRVIISKSGTMLKYLNWIQLIPKHYPIILTHFNF